MIMVTDYEDAIALAAIRTRYNAATTLHLYKNDYTPVPDSADANFTEADFPGYSDEDLAGDWGAITEAADGKWYIQTPGIEFAWSGVGSSNTIYGWYIKDATEVIMAERFASPLLVESDSLPFRLTIRFTYESKAVL